MVPMAELQERSRHIRERIDANRTAGERERVASGRHMEASISHENGQARYERELFLKFAESHLARLVLGIGTDPN